MLTVYVLDLTKYFLSLPAVLFLCIASHFYFNVLCFFDFLFVYCVCVVLCVSVFVWQFECLGPCQMFISSASEVVQPLCHSL